MNTYSYAGVEVKTPSPTKDVPEGKSAYEMMYAPSMQGVPSVKKSGSATGAGEAGTVPSEAELKKLMEQYGGGEQ